MRDFNQFLEEKMQQDEGLGKFITQMGTRALNAVTGGSKQQQPWEVPGAIQPEFQKGWQQILNSGLVGQEAWAKFQELMSTPAGRYQLQRANANMDARTTPTHDRSGNYGSTNGTAMLNDPRPATRSPYE